MWLAMVMYFQRPPKEFETQSKDPIAGCGGGSAPNQSNKYLQDSLLSPQSRIGSHSLLISINNPSLVHVILDPCPWGQDLANGQPKGPLAPTLYQLALPTPACPITQGSVGPVMWLLPRASLRGTELTGLWVGFTFLPLGRISSNVWPTDVVSEADIPTLGADLHSLGNAGSKSSLEERAKSLCMKELMKGSPQVEKI